MMRAIFAILLAAGTAGAALAQTQGAPAQTQDAPAQEQSAPAVIEIRKADGGLVARAMVWQDRTGIEVRVQAAGLPAGQYGVHLHAVGRCEGPAFTSAGPHWNPTGRQHGSLNPAGHHLGDLPNLEVDAQGAGRLEFTIAGAATSGAQGLFDADGTALVIHAGPDDYRTDPSGNSGARIACGVLRAS
jgi:Cu-Zn family superoxide dismutase